MNTIIIQQKREQYKVKIHCPVCKKLLAYSGKQTWFLTNGTNLHFRANYEELTN